MNKISNELRQWMLSEPEKPVSVLVEIKGQHPTVRVGVSKSFSNGSALAREIVKPVTEIAEGEVRQLQAYLEPFSERAPHWLAAANSFVIRTTTESLETIASHPLIKALWLNRRHDLSNIGR